MRRRVTYLEVHHVVYDYLHIMRIQEVNTYLVEWQYTVTHLEIRRVRSIPTPRASHNRAEPRSQLARKAVHGRDSSLVRAVSTPNIIRTKQKSPRDLESGRTPSTPQ